MTRKERLISAVRILCWLILAGAAACLIISQSVRSVGKKDLRSEEEVKSFEGADCILVLGCSVKNGRLSDMLEDRVREGAALWHRGAAPKIIMSGDHGNDGYNEVGPMKLAAQAWGVPGDDIFMDHAGFSTYESIYRAKEIFGVRKMIIVSQEYHLYRALYIARQLGIEAVGVASDPRAYAGQTLRDIREWVARIKDFGWSLLRVKPTYLGDPIDLSGSGSVTDDDDYRGLKESGFIVPE